MHFLRTRWFWGWVALAAGCSGEADGFQVRPGSADLGGGGDAVAAENGSSTGAGGSSSAAGNGGSSSNGNGHSGSSSSGNAGASGSAAGHGGSGSGGSTGSGGSGGAGGASGGGHGGNGGMGVAGAGGSGGSGGSSGAGGSSGTGGAMMCRAEPNHSGGLTQYDPTPLGNCGMPWPSDNLYAAMDTADYMSSAVCGMCVEITGPAGEKTTVHVVDQCPVGSNPKCTAGHLDLSHQAYNATVHTGIGEVPNSSPVSWRYVPCNVTGNITYHFKDGTSGNWVAVQIRNSRYGISKISYRFNGGWRDMDPRTNDLAYFVANGTGLTTFDLRVTDVNGQVLEDDGVHLTPNGDVQGHAQFPSCK